MNHILNRKQGQRPKEPSLTAITNAFVLGITFLLSLSLSTLLLSQPANASPLASTIVDSINGRSSSFSQMDNAKGSQPVLTSMRSPSSSREIANENKDGSASTVGTMPPDIEKILDRGSLIVALLDTDNPPFFMVQKNGQLDGLDVKLARNLANRLGVRVEFNRSATTFNEVVENVFNQEADIAISKISRTMKRIQQVRFSEPYLRMRQGLLVNRLSLAQQTHGRSVPETIRSLEGNVGVIEGSSYVGFLKQKFPDAAIVEYPHWDDIVRAVSEGEVLAAYRDELEIKKVVRTSPNAALQLETIALTDTEDPIAMVLPWTSTHLLAMVDQYLETEKLNYSADTVLQDYADYFSD